MTVPGGTNGPSADLCAQIAAFIRENHRSGVVPPVRRITAVFGLSPGTVIGVLRRLVHDKVIEKPPHRKSYYLCGVRAGESGHRKSRPEVLAAILRREIVQGRLSAASFPSNKELRIRFGCSWATIKRTLELLQAEELVEPKGRGFGVRGATHLSERRTQLYVSVHPRLLDTRQVLGLIRALELDLQDFGWTRPHLLFEPEPTRRRFPQPHSVAGFVHILLSEPEKWVRHYRRYPQVPVALVSTYLTASERAWMGEGMSERMGVVMPDNLRAGREVAVHLFELGHRRVAFLSHVEPAKFGWVSERFQGASRVFGSDIAPRTRLSFHGPSGAVHEEGPVKPEPGDRGDYLLGRARRYLGHYRTLIMSSGVFDEDILQHSLRSTWRYLALWGERRRARDLFERALRDEGVTAWICVNDELAMLALSFLSAAGRSSDIDVIGFDNSFESYRLRLSSYDFSMDRVSHALMQFMRKKTPESPAGRFVHVPGRLVPRSSTRTRR
jgi:DNA-binding LacI/PurR family transcriptional regulator